MLIVNGFRRIQGGFTLPIMSLIGLAMVGGAVSNIKTNQVQNSYYSANTAVFESEMASWAGIEVFRRYLDERTSAEIQALDQSPDINISVTELGTQLIARNIQVSTPQAPIQGDFVQGNGSVRSNSTTTAGGTTHESTLEVNGTGTAGLIIDVQDHNIVEFSATTTGGGSVSSTIQTPDTIESVVSFDENGNFASTSMSPMTQPKFDAQSVQPQANYSFSYTLSRFGSLEDLFINLFIDIQNVDGIADGRYSLGRSTSGVNTRNAICASVDSFGSCSGAPVAVLCDSASSFSRCVSYSRAKEALVFNTSNLLPGTIFVEGNLAVGSGSINTNDEAVGGDVTLFENSRIFGTVLASGHALVQPNVVVEGGLIGLNNHSGNFSTNIISEDFIVQEPVNNNSIYLASDIPLGDDSAAPGAGGSSGGGSVASNGSDSNASGQSSSGQGATNAANGQALPARILWTRRK